ncbi:hypothetical protein M413DRAFT_449556 [Hebeloma cylindrosporum]|uniref:RNA polymerase II-associated protein 3 n=1 Tax=Hebeloma cylindrosporum TaxID=76867 RepID=A0A0C2Y4D2_HEBCY|nr:hypothetical protein M413DRAFT_449556 [Hebeloma cylindrosporum h7]
MSKPKALAAKDKGNAAFKGGDYPTAIGHYTAAILADRNDPTYPLNRAAAYLKLGKYEDAERDCTTVIGLDASNVKALFRRGQARVGTGNLLQAQSDFGNVLRIDPANNAAQEELQKVAALIQNEKSKKSKVSIPPVQDVAAATKRRRVPIKIVDPSGSASAKLPEDRSPVAPLVKPKPVEIPKKPISQPDTLEPVSTRFLNPVPPTVGESSSSEPTEPKAKTSPPESTTKPSNSKPQNFKDAKQARESVKPSRVGGGIFRTTGQNTIFPTREIPTPESSVEPDLQTTSSLSSPLEEVVPPLGGVHKPPPTFFEFSKSWWTLNSPEKRWKLITSIPPTQLPALCKTSLEPPLLVSILDTFSKILTVSASNPDGGKQFKNIITQYMEHFTKIPRFSTLVLFLSRAEKDVAKQVWTLLGVGQPEGAWHSVA